ncbi:hypothetical protein [Psychromonas sp. MME2]|uniref:hypothetical protein n=1 Tax=unclassified Psychromonas TaxID=2614957 RepID=UPI00339CE0C4
MIKAHINKLEKAFNAITLRERVIIFAGLLFSILVINYYWIIEPAQLKQVKIEKTLALSYKKENELNKEVARVKGELKKDPLQEINTQIAFSERTLVSLDKTLDEKLVKFIRAQKMPIALTKVLSKSTGVKIESLVSLPVKAFNAENSQAGSDMTKTLQNPFYKHTLAVTLSGDYNAIYRYLVNLENIPEKFYWSALTYQVTHYPLAQVTIEIYTLSDQQDLVSG